MKEVLLVVFMSVTELYQQSSYYSTEPQHVQTLPQGAGW